MAAARQPLFLARDSYRKRRLRDGARVLPIFGTVLVLLPLMWPAVPQMVLAHWVFVFVLWVVLIGLAAVLARGLGDSETVSSQESTSPPAQDGHVGTARVASRPADLLPDTPPNPPRAVHDRP
jgi:hypothetical protein